MEESMPFRPRAEALVRPVPNAVTGAALALCLLAAAPTIAGASPGAAGARAAVGDHPSRIRVAPPSEPGEPLLVAVRVADAGTGRPIPGASLHVYQTDHAGYYARDGEGRERGPRHARLHATAYADSTGSILIETIVPGSYPGSGVPRHIHYRLEAGGYEGKVREILFDESPRITDAQKRHAERNGDTVVRRARPDRGRSEIRVTLTLQPAKEG
jgi:protocatechuate 3,4-dioxygenase beta subunit